MSVLKDLVDVKVPINSKVMKNALSMAVETKLNKDVSAVAYMILDHTGFRAFLEERGVWTEAWDHLTQLMANRDKAGAKDFLCQLVDAIANEDDE